MEITLPDQTTLYFHRAGFGDQTFILIHGGGGDTSPFGASILFLCALWRHH
jgi:hypothetical protein